MKGLILLVVLFWALSVGTPASGGIDLQPNTEFLKISFELWKDSMFGQDPKEAEEAMWIVCNAQGEYNFVKWQRSGESRGATWKGAVPLGAVAQIHTHPEKVDPKPSVQDRFISHSLNLPVFTVSRSGIWEVLPNGETNRFVGMGWYLKVSK